MLTDHVLSVFLRTCFFIQNIYILNFSPSVISRYLKIKNNERSIV